MSIYILRNFLGQSPPLRHLNRTTTINLLTSLNRSFSSTNSSSPSNQFRINVSDHLTDQISSSIRPSVSLETANNKQILRSNINNAIAKFKKHDCDTGSSQVQIGILTEKIKSLVKHFMTNKKDYASMRGYSAMIHKRRKLMNYMKKNDFEAYKVVVKVLNLEKEDRKLR